MEKIKLLLYCTKSKPILYKGITAYTRSVEYVLDKEQYLFGKTEMLNGKIVAECDFEVEEIFERVSLNDSWFNDLHHTKTMKNDELLKKSCLKVEEMNKYFDYPKNTLDKVGYAIHIKNLNIFDKPRELFNYETQEIWNNTSHYHRTIMKTPQNMMHCYGINTGDKYILISISPEWLCKILNHEKTIEVRKKVLKEMITDA